jgi:hypothetical protein
LAESLGFTTSLALGLVSGRLALGNARVNKRRSQLGILSEIFGNGLLGA